MKPIDTRILEARARARTAHVRLYAQPDHSYRTRSAGGDWYTLTHTHEGWSCSCPGWHFSGACKHLAALVRRSEREGWTVTTIAPAPYVPDTQAAD